MKSYDNYAQLELLSTHSTDSLLYPPTVKPAARASLRDRFAAVIHQASTACVQFLIGSSSPTIRQRRDRTGKQYFLVQDPVSGKSRRFSSEQDVREWLDGRYNA